MTNQPTPIDLDRQPGENVYDYEDRLVKHFNPDACLCRTSNGAPWAMPCTRPEGHDGECRFDCPEILFSIRKVESDE